MNAISRFPVPELAALPEDIRARIVAVNEKAGFIPNVFLAWAHRPDEFRAFFAYHDALLEKDGGLSKAEREMIVVATSSVNHCHYCVIAHGAILRIRAKHPLLADQVAVLSDGQVVAQGTLADIGGRASAQTQIRFVLPAGCLAADLPAWARPPVDPAAEPAAGPAARPEPGDLVTVAVSEPTRALHELTSWALQRGLVLDQLTVEPPSLEDVYIHLTGKELRE